MLRPSLRRRSGAGAIVLAIGATTLFGGAGTAHATHGPSGELTSSDGTHTLVTGDGVGIGSADYTITDAAWSPDGSRAVFVTGYGDIATIGDSMEVYPIAEAQTDVTRATPEWVGDGSTVVWAAKEAGSPWRIEGSVSAVGFDVVRRSPDDGNHYSEPDTNGSSRLVVQRQAADSAGNAVGTPEIGFLDGSTYTRIATDAASPTISADGSKVAFVRGEQIWVRGTAAGAAEVQVTIGGTAKADPVLNADGKTVAFAQGGTTVGTAPTTAGAPVTTIPYLPGVPDYRPAKKDRVVRLAGSDRYGTASAISQSHWASHSNASDPRAKATVAVLSRSDTFADALGGSALAAAKNGPLLMTPTTTLAPAVATELTRVLKPGSTVYLLGSAAGALSTTVENQVRSLGFTPVRLAGTDRYATSIAIANAIDPTPDKVLAATGANFPDALAAGAAAGAQNLPGKGTSAVVILTKDSTLTPATLSYFDALPASTEIYGIGLWGDIATRPYGGIPVSGSTRYETALYVAYAFFGGYQHIGVATGANWPDALAGGALMGSLDAPLILAPGTAGQVGDEIWYLGEEMAGSVHTGLVFGSAAVMNDVQRNGLGFHISGPAGYTPVTNATDVLRTTDGTSTATARASAPRDGADVAAAVKAGKERLAER
ncbi:cell wall-binding repeat-containing protein [Micromonospora thermarum]|uniref:Cell wall-binding repeat-containing protein n=1 Tax=Micromonospora thermarum TaxID=2720024 RepID=A0ABX0Z114_9ACTN|nr:cell wall-binding repeat-containing protein [Micromonospora thermarum]NJP30689.1 hypothetical protein [Micromonospora thermarum]